MAWKVERGWLEATGLLDWTLVRADTVTRIWVDSYWAGEGMAYVVLCQAGSETYQVAGGDPQQELTEPQARAEAQRLHEAILIDLRGQEDTDWEDQTGVYADQTPDLDLCLNQFTSEDPQLLADLGITTAPGVKLIVWCTRPHGHSGSWDSHRGISGGEIFTWDGLGYLIGRQPAPSS